MDITSVCSGPVLLERRHVKCRGDTVSKHGFHDVSDGMVNDVLDSNEVNGWVCFRSELDPFSDNGKMERALDPAVLHTERVQVILEVLFDATAFMVKRECQSFRWIEFGVLYISPEPISLLLGLHC